MCAVFLSHSYLPRIVVCSQSRQGRLGNLEVRLNLPVHVRASFGRNFWCFGFKTTQLTPTSDAYCPTDKILELVDCIRSVCDRSTNPIA